jgi:hypothetical protein
MKISTLGMLVTVILSMLTSIVSGSASARSTADEVRRLLPGECYRPTCPP